MKTCARWTISGKTVLASIIFAFSAFALFAEMTLEQARLQWGDHVVAIYTDNNGKEVVVVMKDSPPTPPVDYARPLANLKQSAKTLTAPAFDWTYGCSATSAGMMMGFYDRGAYPNLYKGPTNNGVCPLTNAVWGKSVYPSVTCGNCPIVASKNGVDERTTRGHVDDYWYDVESVIDPYYGNWTEHTPKDCLGDFMGTNQYHNWGCVDGSTAFGYYPSGAPFVPTETSEYRDGTLGIKYYLESCGYAADTYFNQLIDSQASGGYTFAQYQSEIDAGRPVIIHVVGHTMLGVGYDTSGNVVILHDTWDYQNHEMTWGGSYSGLQQDMVSVIHLENGGGGDKLDVTPSYLSRRVKVGASASSDTLTVKSKTTESVGFIVTTSGTDTSWLDCSPKSGTATTAGTSVTVNYSTASLAVGPHTATIKFTTADGTETISVPVTMEIYEEGGSATLYVSPTAFSVTMAVGVNPDARNFAVWAEGGTINYSINVSDSWMVCSPTSGSSSGEQDIIALSFNAASLTTGVYTGTITVTPDTGSAKTIPVTLAVGAPLMVTPTTLARTCGKEMTATSQSFQVWNAGTNTLSFSCQVSAGASSWLSCSPSTGTSTGVNDIRTVTVRYNSAALAVGIYQGTITVMDSADATNKQTVSVTLTVTDDPTLIASDTELDLSLATTFSIHNSGTGIVTYAVSDNASWLSVTPSSGKLSANGTLQDLSVTYNTDGLSMGYHEALITIAGYDAYGNIALNSPRYLTAWINVGGGATPTGGLAISVTELNNRTTSGQNAPAQNFQIWSENGSRYYALASSASWLSLSPSSGSSSGEHNTIAVNYNTSSLTGSSYTAFITAIETDASGVPISGGSEKTIEVTLTIGEPATATLEVSSPEIFTATNLGSNPVPQPFTVWAAGGTIPYALTVNQFWLSVSPISGSSSGEHDTIAINYNASSLPEGSYSAHILISPTDSSSAIAAQTIIVKLKVGSGYSSPPVTNSLVFGLSASKGGMTLDPDNRVSFWPDAAGVFTGAAQRSIGKQPYFSTIGITHSKPAVLFTGRQGLLVPSNSAINIGGPYSQKTVGMVFKTDGDIWTKQVLFEQGNSANGFNIYIEGGYLFMGAWSSSDTATFFAAPIITSTLYSAVLLYNQTAHQFQGWLNGNQIASKSDVGSLAGGKESVSIGYQDRQSRYFTSGAARGFVGAVAEVWYYNSALSSDDLAVLQGYLNGKYSVNPTPMPLPFDGLTFWSRAYDLVGVDAYGVYYWGDSSGSPSRFAQKDKKARPEWIANYAGRYALLSFNGCTDYMVEKKREKDIEIKTVFLVFRTGDNIDTTQSLWSEGDKNEGFHIYLENGSVYLGAWQMKGKSAWGMKFLNAAVTTNTNYCVELDFNIWTNELGAAVNGARLTSETDIGRLSVNGAAIGAVNGSTLFHNNEKRGKCFFSGGVMELIVYDCALTTGTGSQTAQVQDYLSDLYGINFAR